MFPLFKHRNGQWAKKIKGKTHYFGTDRDKALKRFLDERDYLYAGAAVPTALDVLSEVCGEYYEHCRQRVELGELGERHLADIDKTLKKVVEHLPANPRSWTPVHFAKFKQALYQPIPRSKDHHGRSTVNPKRRSHVTVLNDVRRVRAFLTWAVKTKLIESVDYGGQFDLPSARVQRVEKGETIVFTPTELRSVIASAAPNLKPVILLGINGGMGARDIAALTLAQVRGAEWLRLKRGKTGVHRKVWLWPETREAIAQYLDTLRIEPHAAQYKDVAFLTTHRVPWVRGTLDSASQMFAKLASRAGVDGRFYSLRRTFQSIAEESGDFPAVSTVMGHADASMSAVYRKVSDDRVRKVCETVRKWLGIGVRQEF